MAAGVSSPSELLKAPIQFLVYRLGVDPTEHTASNSSFIVACITVAVIM
jgi:hypothetical protein